MREANLPGKYMLSLFYISLQLCKLFYKLIFCNDGDSELLCLFIFGTLRFRIIINQEGGALANTSRHFASLAFYINL